MSEEGESPANRPAPGASPINGLVPPPEHRFQPGRSGNPSGRPKVERFVSTAIAELQDSPGKTVQACISAFKKARGSRLCGADHKAIALFRSENAARERSQVGAINVALDRLEGKVTQGIDVSGAVDVSSAIAMAHAEALKGPGSES
jgi:hypothetical protein